MASKILSATRDMRPSRMSGFTLVELLVVICIIALLISILLPAVRKARFQSQTVACASNLRQFGLALEQYANENHGFIPLACWFGVPSQTMVINTGQVSTQPGNPPLLGPLGDALFTTGLVRDPQPYYCPLQANAAWQYATSDNPFPFVKGKTMKLDYGTRPMSDALPNGSGPYAGYRYSSFLDTSTNTRFVPLPKLTQLHSYTAIASDAIPSGNVVRYFLSAPQGHFAKGVNVFYNDCSVAWVPASVYLADYGNGLEGGTGTCHCLIGGLNPTGGIFYDFDTFHGR